MSIDKARTVMAMAAMFERAAAASVAKGAQVDMSSMSHGYNPNSPHNLIPDPHGVWSAVADKIIDLIDQKVAEALQQQGKSE